MLSQEQCDLTKTPQLPCNDDLNDKMEVEVDESHAAKLRRRRHRHQCITITGPEKASLEPSGILDHRKSVCGAELSDRKERLVLQRSHSLQEFDGDALPVNLDNPSPAPKSPVIQKAKPGHFLTRRSTFVNTGQVFQPSDIVSGDMLGEGFYGKAIKVTHKVSGDVMVMKELVNCDPDGQKGFLQEVALLRGLRHPNVLAFIGILYKEQKLHIITEFVGGGTLEEFLHLGPQDPLSVTRKLKIGLDVSSGMEYLHSQNVIHRDLNSPNCLMKEDGTVIVADFGLSRLTRGDNLSSWHTPKDPTSPNPGKRVRKKKYTVVGNPYWMAPEMLRGEKYDELVDVFSFGILMCEVIGRVRADPDYLPRLSTFAVNKEVFLNRFCVGCPEEFSSLALQCCDISSDARPRFDEIYKTLWNIYLHQAKLERHNSIHCSEMMEYADHS